MVEVSDGGADAGVAELLGDDSDVNPFFTELGGMGMPETVGVDSLVNARAGGETFQQDTDVGGGHRVSAERAEDGLAASHAE